MSEPATPARRLLRRLGAVPDAAMRQALWREAFDTLAPGDLLAAVDGALTGAGRREEDARLAYQALLAHLDALRGHASEARRALYEAARFAENDAVCRMLLTAPPAKQPTAAELRHMLSADDRELTLGERRALARTRDRNVLARRLADPDPGVVDNLLQNPRLTEADVLRIASRRPVAGASLRAIFLHARWGRLPAVRRALIYNPYTPTDLALGLLPLLDLAELRDLAREPGGQALLRTRAQAILREREPDAAASTERLGGG